MQDQTETSSKRAEANRQNAQKSTGPRTQAGKARSARNSTRHALLAKAATLMAEPDQELEAILTRFKSDLRPSLIHEEVLVQQMAIAAWRMRQGTRIEVGLLAFQMQETYQRLLDAGKPIQWSLPVADCNGVERQPAELDEPEEPELADAGSDTRKAAIGAAWADNPAVFALVMRYQNQANRDYFRAMKHLELLRSGKAGYLPDDQPPAQPQPAESEPEPAENETKPIPTPAVVAAPPAANQANQTNPNFVDIAPRSEATVIGKEPLRNPKGDGNLRNPQDSSYESRTI